MNKAEKLFYNLQDIEISVMPTEQYTIRKIELITETLRQAFIEGWIREGMYHPLEFEKWIKDQEEQ